MQHRREIDGLRAVAVVPVVLFHAGFGAFSGGYVGVDVFFVISGYLITTIILADLAAGRFSIGSFYERRARRILPTLFFIIACCIPLAWALMLPPEFEAFSESVLATLFFYSNVLFWRKDDYFGPNAEEEPLLHTWSLAIEEQFYLIFPVFLVLSHRLRLVHKFVVFGLLGLTSLLASEWGWRYAPSANFYLLPWRAWELLGGVLCALVLRDGRPLDWGRCGSALSALGLVSILAAIALYDEATPIPSVYALAPVAGTCLFILFAHRDSLPARLLSLGPFVGIGLISYSAYLWHQPLLAFAHLSSQGAPRPVVLGGLAAVSFAFAYLTWRLIEVPFRHGMPLPVVLRYGGVAALLIGAVAFAGVWSRGFEMLFLKYRMTAEGAALYELVQQQASPKILMVDDGECRFSSPTIDSAFEERFDKCRLLHGRAWVVLGDSHAMNIYNILAKAKVATFLVGVVQPGCRPHDTAAKCQYSLFNAFAKRQAQSISVTLYHQSGSYFLKDLHGKVDSAKTFLPGASWVLDDENVDEADAYIEKLSAFGRVVWLGPFVESRVELNALGYLDGGLKIKSTSLSHFSRLDAYLKRMVGERKRSYTYMSLADFLAIDADFLRVGNCVTYRDADHFSACGEDLLAARDWGTLLGDHHQSK